MNTENKEVHLTVGGVIYNIVKKAKINSETLTPEEWKKVEADIVDAILSTVYPGDEIPEDQLTFSHISSTLSFMNELITKLNSFLKQDKDETDDNESETDNSLVQDDPEFIV